MRLQTCAAGCSQARGSGSAHEGAFTAERAQRAQEAPAARPPSPNAGSSRAGAGSGGHRAASGIGAKATRTEDDRGPPSTATDHAETTDTPPTTRQNTTTDRNTLSRRGARGAGRRADATGEGAAAKGRKAGRPPKHSRGVAGRARDELSQRAHNEHSRPAIMGIMATHNRIPYGQGPRQISVTSIRGQWGRATVRTLRPRRGGWAGHSPSSTST